jgi:hypothetical protein
MDLGAQNKRQTMMSIVLVVVLIAIGLIAYFGYFRQPSPEQGFEMPAMGEGAGQPEEVIKKIDFDAEFLKETRFQALKIYGQWPIKLENGEKGRPNPFLSLEKSAEEEIEEEIEEIIEEEIEEETGTTTPEGESG